MAANLYFGRVCREPGAGVKVQILLLLLLLLHDVGRRLVELLLLVMMLLLVVVVVHHHGRHRLLQCYVELRKEF